MRRNQGRTAEVRALVKEIEGRYSVYEKACGRFLYKSMGLTYAEDGNFSGAKDFLEAYYGDSRGDQQVYRALVAVYFMLNDSSNIKSFGEAFQMMKDREFDRYEGLIRFYEKRGLVDDVAILRRLQGR
jgi:hypothetical protein